MVNENLEFIIKTIRAKFRYRVTVIRGVSFELLTAQGHPAHARGDILCSNDLKETGGNWENLKWTKAVGHDACSLVDEI
jgi:hypothetical protein